MQIENDENGGSEQPSCSDVGQIALRKMLEKEIEPMVLNIVRRVMKPMVINTVQQVMEPVAEDLFRRVVKEEIQSVEEKLLAGGTRTRNVLPKERNLHLKFLDELCDTVQTGKELKGTNDECLKLVLLDANEHTVTCDPESSAKVEILLLDDNGNDDDNIMSHGNFERRIITPGDKEKPHFAKSVYIKLDKGIANLSGLKLGHDKDWTKLCNCRLGARIAQNLPGTIVQKAWTEPFKVKDKRGKHYEKHHPPNLSSEVWRLDKIARKGEPCNRLEVENIKTLKDFLFWYYVNPERLKQILNVGDGLWKIIVTHAETCLIDDKMFSHKSSTEPQMLDIYDHTVGKLKGVINESHFVRIGNLCADEKAHACKLLISVFGERYNTSFDVEASLLQEFPYNTSTNSSLQHCSSGSGLPLSENISGYQTTEQGSSSQSIDPSNFIDDSGPSDSLGSKEMGELCNPTSGPFPDPKTTVGGNPTDLGCGNMTALGTCTGPLLTSETVGESSSRHSNASFHSVSSTMEYQYYGFDDQCWGMNEWSPNPMLLHYADNTYSHNTQIYGHQDELGGDEGSGAASAEPRVVDPPNRWKKLSRLLFSFRERIDVTRSSHKKRKVG